MFRYLAEVGLDIDIVGLHRDHPEVAWHSLPAWAGGRTWDVAATG